MSNKKMKFAERDELIGLDIEVVEARNRSNVGIIGKVIDETKNTLTVAAEKGRKKLLKSAVTIKIKGEKVNGELLIGRPEDRIKR